jgi:hypothetical protein
MKARVIITITTILLLLSSVRTFVPFIPIAKASGTTEIKYDDGSWEDHWQIGTAYKVGVMFSKSDLPYSQNLLATVEIYIYYAEAGQQLTMFFLNSSFDEIIPPVFTPILKAGWNNIDVSSYNLVMTDSFLIGLQWLNPDGSQTAAWLGYDLNNSANWVHSYGYDPYKYAYPYWNSPCDPTGGSKEYGNWMIRAVVEEVPLTVVPEVPFGTILISATMLFALAAYMTMSRRRAKRDLV